jgi:hypothetical protein
MHTEVQLLLLSCTGCCCTGFVQHVNTARWSLHAGSADHLYTRRHTDDYWRVVQLECAVAAVCQLFLLLHAQGSCKTYTQPGTPLLLADLAQEKVQAITTTNLLSLNSSVACSCLLGVW